MTDGGALRPAGDGMMILVQVAPESRAKVDLESLARARAALPHMTDGGAATSTGAGADGKLHITTCTFALTYLF